MSAKLALFASLIFYYTFAQSQTAILTPDLQAETDSGLSIAIFSEVSPLEINMIHSWRLVIRDSRQQPVNNATINVTGGMPDHDHGIPTQPQVTSQPAAGSYLLEGVRFHMPGKWQIIVSVETEQQSSQAVIEFTL